MLQRAHAGNQVAAGAFGLGRFAREMGREGERVGKFARTRRRGRWPYFFLSLNGGLVERFSGSERGFEPGFEARFESWIGKQGDVDVLEDLTGGDAENAVGGFDQIVALAAGVLTAENVGEGEAGGELLGFDQKAGAVGDPWRGCFHVLTRSCLDGEVKMVTDVKGGARFVFCRLLSSAKIVSFLLRGRMRM